MNRYIDHWEEWLKLEYIFGEGVFEIWKNVVELRNGSCNSCQWVWWGLNHSMWMCDCDNVCIHFACISLCLNSPTTRNTR